MVGGALTAAAVPPWSLPWLAPLGICLLALATGGHRWQVGALAGGVFGLVYFGMVAWWLWASVAPGAWMALTLVQAGWFALVGAGFALSRRLPWWPAWAAVAWSAGEGVRATWPWGGMPWGRLGFSAVDAPWSAVLSVLGVTGTGFLVAFLGTSLAAFLQDVPVRRWLAGVHLAPWVVALVLLPLVSAWTDVTVAGRARIALVQGGVPGEGTQVARYHRAITDAHLAETRRLVAGQPAGDPGLEVVVWPENATAVDATEDPIARERLMAAVEAASVPVLAGSISEGPSGDTARNQSILWTSDGPSQRYTKRHLVPFGEYVPLRPIANRISSRVAVITTDMVPGGPANPIRLDGLELAVALCFDVAYDDVIGPQVDQGADLITVQTSNAMFTGTAQLEQQWTITRARAIESGRAVAVASINGISGAIAPDGGVIARLPERVTTSRIVEVPLATGTTWATRLDRWPSRLVTALAVVGGFLFWRSARRRA